MPKPPRPPRKPKRHYIGPDGNRLPSVTEIMGQNLGWKADALYGYFYKRGKEGLPMREHAKGAAEYGTRVHDLASELLGGDYADVPEDLRALAMPNAQRIVDKIRELGWRVLYTEIAMQTDHIAGTADLIVMAEVGTVGVVDIKTGFVAEEVSAQLAAYGMLWETKRGDLPSVTWGAVIQARTGEPLNVIPVTMEQLVAGGEIFMHCLGIHKARDRAKVRP